jgi:hypothetical protein
VCLHSCLSYPACKSHLSCAVLYCHKWYDFRKNVSEHKMSLDFLYNIFWNFSHYKKKRARYYHTYTMLLSDVNQTWTFSTDFRKILKSQNFIKMRPLGAGLCHADGRTDKHDEAISCERVYKLFFHGTAARMWPRPPHCRGYTITFRHTTLGKTPLDGWSARHRDL